MDHGAKFDYELGGQGFRWRLEGHNGGLHGLDRYLACNHTGELRIKRLIPIETLANVCGRSDRLIYSPRIPLLARVAVILQVVLSEQAASNNGTKKQSPSSHFGSFMPPRLQNLGKGSLEFGQGMHVYTL